MENSKIEWTHHTFNPWRGCAKVSPGCKNCYAEARANRFGSVQGEWGENAMRVVASDATWNDPRKWNKQAGKEGVRKRVFCASLADVFEDYQGGKVVNHKLEVIAETLLETRERLFDLIADTPNLDWLLLTKRPENIGSILYETIGWVDTLRDQVPDNIWLGTSAENQEAWMRRVPRLLKIPARVHFVSCEPLISLINMPHAKKYPDWVICGGESGPNARRMKAFDARILRDDCQQFGIQFYFKQWGEFDHDGNRVGKKNAGRMLDGREWNQFPNEKVTA